MEMRNICLINKVVDSLLETKIQKLIESYSDIQNAFHTIQSKTVNFLLISVDQWPDSYCKQVLLLRRNEPKSFEINFQLWKIIGRKNQNKQVTQVTVKKAGVNDLQ